MLEKHYEHFQKCSKMQENGDKFQTEPQYI